MGMTDLQFKAYVKSLIRNIEHIEAQKSEEAIRRELEKMKADLQEIMEG